MDRSIALLLNAFPAVPDLLRIDPAIDVALDKIDANLASLFHHYYLDSYGIAPPDPDPAHFEHLKFLSACQDFRFRGEGLGISPGVKRSRSQEMGQAFARWFLHDFLRIAHFAPMHEVLDRQAAAPFQQFKLVRIATGDAPDYLCAQDDQRPHLLEAKGRYSRISFTSHEFASWRDQFGRVELRNAAGQAETIKGYVVATRFATEAKPRLKSTLYAEDPESSGDQPIGEGARLELARAIIGIHYSRIAEILGLPILAASLRTGFVIPEEILVPVTVWELQLPPLKGMRFVGGYFPNGGGVRPLELENGKILFTRHNAFQLGIGNGTFIGLEEKIFTQIVERARGSQVLGTSFEALPLFPPIYSAISILRDGSIISPIEFLTPIRQVVL